ncbi:MAG: SURF1 family protein [Angustibacter sp.]
MLRTALQPRWLSLLALVFVVCVGFGWLGAWQLGVAQDRATAQARERAASSPTAPLAQVLSPQRGFPTEADARSVVASGRYDPSRQVLVGGRLQQGRPGWWVVAALRTDTGAWLPVVRGWVPAPQDPAASASRTPAGAVRVTGVLQPDEAPPSDPVTLTGDQVASLDAAELAGRWGTPIYNGFLVTTVELDDTGAAVGAGAPQPVRVPPPGPQPSGLNWRNAAYAVQWWVFAGFAVLLWWRMVRQAAQGTAATAAQGTAATAAQGTAATAAQDDKERTCP